MREEPRERMEGKPELHLPTSSSSSALVSLERLSPSQISRALPLSRPSLISWFLSSLSMPSTGSIRPLSGRACPFPMPPFYFPSVSCRARRSVGPLQVDTGERAASSRDIWSSPGRGDTQGRQRRRRALAGGPFATRAGPRALDCLQLRCGGAPHVLLPELWLCASGTHRPVAPKAAYVLSEEQGAGLFEIRKCYV